MRSGRSRLRSWARPLLAWCGRAGSPQRAPLKGVTGCAISTLGQPTQYPKSSENTHAVQTHAPGAMSFRMWKSGEAKSETRYHSVVV